ncbi:hypothetical protein QU39_00145, partial [Staphylococcus aureus]
SLMVTGRSTSFGGPARLCAASARRSRDLQNCSMTETSRLPAKSRSSFDDHSIQHGSYGGSTAGAPDHLHLSGRGVAAAGAADLRAGGDRQG